MAATSGTTPLNVTCSRNRAPAPANVEPVDCWMRAPAESSSHTSGMRQRSAISRMRAVLRSPTAPIAPPIDLADAGDHAVGGQVVVAGRDQAGIHVVGEEPVLHEGARVEQLVDAL